MEAILFYVLTLSAVLFSGAHSAIFTIRNNCPYTIYPAFLTSSGAPAPTGFEVHSQSSYFAEIQPPWTGRLWARFVCSVSGTRFLCLSGDCGTGQISCLNQGGTPPATLIQYTLGGNDGKDVYDVSLVDGFNLPVKLEPQSGECKAAGCLVDINSKCPEEFAIRNTIGGGVIGCKSACLAFNQPQYCCTGPFGSPSTCKPSNYSLYFKSQCPNAITYAFDATGTYTCTTGTNYLVTFCP